MKNKLLVLSAFFVLTSFASPIDSKLALSPIEIEENKMCKAYKDELRKFLGAVIKLPIRLNQHPPFNFERIPQKTNGRDLIRFKYKGMKRSEKYQVEISKQINTTDGTKIDVVTMPTGKALSENRFISFISLPNLDYNWVSKVEDIYVDPNTGLALSHTMKLISQEGENCAATII